MQGHGVWCSSCSSQSRTAKDGQVLHGGPGILSRFSFFPSLASPFLSLISFLSFLLSPSFLFLPFSEVSSIGYFTTRPKATRKVTNILSVLITPVVTTKCLRQSSYKERSVLFPTFTVTVCDLLVLLLWA